MTVAAPPSPSQCRYQALFPSWEGTRPLLWYFAEQLLEARAVSDFPTNAAGNDEDVNVYLIARLAEWALGDGREGIRPGRDPILAPPPSRWPAWRRADHHRRQADHRLLCLGLFDRGDLVRRRLRGWLMTEDETRERDLAVLRHGYRQAVDLLEGRDPAWAGPVGVWRKLERHATRYIHVLQTLARLRLDLGARLGDATLQRLAGEDPVG
jgi:hypothetical protein